jgi:sec-independent protein translocase protein TatB
MFDISFSELLVIAVVALVVIGPERLPKVARTVGVLLGRAQRYVSDVKADINREVALEELKSLQQNVVQSAQEIESTVRGGTTAAVAQLEQELNQIPPSDASAQPTVSPEPAAATHVVTSSKT